LTFFRLISTSRMYDIDQLLLCPPLSQAFVGTLSTTSHIQRIDQP
jgi:hypothetical protein